MPYLCRLIIVVVLIGTGLSSFSQIIEKAPPSPVAVQTAPLDSLHNVVLLADIFITGYKRTKPYIIERELPFRKGETMSSEELAKRLNLCKQRLMNTSLFVDVDVIPIKLDSATVYVDVHVKERWYLFPIPYFQIVSRNLNTWWVEEHHSLSRTEYGMKFTQNNVTGRNDNLSVWLIGGYTQQVSLRYDNPNIDAKLKHGINIGFGFSRNREINYLVDSNKQEFLKTPNDFILRRQYADFTYTYRPAIKTRHSFRIGYTSLTINDTVTSLNPHYFNPYSTKVNFIDLSYTLSYQNVDYNPYPLKGFAGEASFTKRFGSGLNVWQLMGRANYDFKLFPSSYVEFQGVGLIRFPTTQPYISNNLMGSANFYMRGLEYYVIEGTAGGVLRATAKNEVLSFNFRSPIKSKTHDKIPFRVFVKAYGDLGYAYSENYGNSRLNNKLLRTWGAGIDIVTFYDVVIRLEYSFNQLHEDGLFVHNQNDW